MFDKLKLAVFVMLNAMTPNGLLVTLNPKQSKMRFDVLKSKQLPPFAITFVDKLALSLINPQLSRTRYVVKLETLKIIPLLPAFERTMHFGELQFSKLPRSA